jgi:hypothetical protein
MYVWPQQRAIATCKEDASSSGPLSKTAPNTAPTPQWCEAWAYYLSTRFAGAAAASIVTVSADGKSYTISTTATAAFVKEVVHISNTLLHHKLCIVLQLPV